MAVKTVQAIINGVTTTLTLNSSTGKYEATITAPSKSSYTINDGHYYPVRQRMWLEIQRQRRIQIRPWESV